MVLAVDIGNSNIVMGGYRQDALLFSSRMATDRHMETDQYAVQLFGILQLHGLNREKIEGIVLCSVVPGITARVAMALEQLTRAKVYQLSLADSGDITIAIDNPAELGADILASAIAVRQSRPLPAVIIDMGTATKLTALDANGALRGVAIAPGVFLSLEALLKGASQLGGIPLTAPATAIGVNTAHSMQSGVILGAASMLDGMIDRFAAEMGDVVCAVATGGAASLVVPHCRHEIELSNTLLLDGLYTAWRRTHLAQQ